MVPVVTEDKVMETLRECYDPEIPISIVDLGFVKGIHVEDGKVRIKLTLTTPGCPMQDVIADNVRQKVLSLKGVRDVEVEFVFDKPWTEDEMSDDQ